MSESGLAEIIKSLNDADARYLVVGPLAVVAHGCMPLTDKFELCLAVGVGSAERVWRCLAGMGYGRGVENDVPVVLDERVDFADMEARAERFELAAGVVVPVCGYKDLVRLKRLLGHPRDLADVDQLEKVRRVRPAYDPWYECTWEGNELWGLWRWADLTLGEKMRSLEESRKVGWMFREARRRMGLPARGEVY